MSASIETRQGRASWRAELRGLVHLALPLALSELAGIAIVTTDVLMMGRLGPAALAAGSLASHFYWFILIPTIGVLAALAPILAQDLGARRTEAVPRAVRHAAWIAVALAVPGIGLIWQAGSILALLGQDPSIAAASQSYLRWMALGFLPTLWQVVLIGFLAAHSRPRDSLVVTVLAIGLNAILDYGLMFGELGLPRFGLDGAGIASALVNSFMLAALLVFVLLDRQFRRYRLLHRIFRLDGGRIAAFFRIGLPIAGTYLAEIGIFLASSLLMGLLGTAPLAAHAVAIQCVAIAYMVPAGISQAATVRVGLAAGAGDAPRVARAGWTAIGLAVALALVPAAAFWGWSDAIVALFLDAGTAEQQATVRMATGFLAIAALFQIADAMQVVTLGALRGLKDTARPMLIAILGYWGIGFGVAALCGIHFGLGGEGIWIGLAAGLMLVCVLLVWRFRLRTARPNP